MPKPILSLLALLAVGAAVLTCSPSGPAGQAPSSTTEPPVFEDAVALIADNASACANLGERKYSMIQALGAGLYDNGIYDKENGAITRSLDLQQRVLDQVRAARRPAPPAVARLFGAESALCNLVATPRGTLLSFGLDKNRLQSDYDVAQAQLMAEIGSAPFHRPLPAAWRHEIDGPGATGRPVAAWDRPEADEELDRRAKAAVAQAEADLADRDAALRASRTPAPAAAAPPPPAPLASAPQEWLVARRQALERAIADLAAARDRLSTAQAALGPSCAAIQATIDRLTPLGVTAYLKGYQAMEWLRRGQFIGCHDPSPGTLSIQLGEARASLSALLAPGAR